MSSLVPATLERWFTKAFRDRAPARIEQFAEMIGATPSEGYAGCCDVLAVADLRPRLSDISCPVQVICGGHDPSTPPARGEGDCCFNKGAQMVSLDAAHISAVEAPDAFASELSKFVSRAVSANNIMRRIVMKKTAFAMGLLSAVATVSPLAAQDLPKVSIVVFGAPSLGAFLPPIIKAQKLDEKNGLSINF
jgi:hypothetical protein